MGLIIVAVNAPTEFDLMEPWELSNYAADVEVWGIDMPAYQRICPQCGSITTPVGEPSVITGFWPNELMDGNRLCYRCHTAWTPEQIARAALKRWNGEA